MYMFGTRWWSCSTKVYKNCETWRTCALKRRGVIAMAVLDTGFLVLTSSSLEARTDEMNSEALGWTEFVSERRSSLPIPAPLRCIIASKIKQRPYRINPFIDYYILLRPTCYLARFRNNGIVKRIIRIRIIFNSIKPIWARSLLWRRRTGEVVGHFLEHEKCKKSRKSIPKKLKSLTA